MISNYKNKKFIIGVVVLFAVMGLFFYNALKNSYPNAVHGKVISYSKGKKTSSKNNKYNYVDVKITSVNYKDKIISVQNFSSGHIKSEDVNTANFAAPGDEVLLNIKEDSKGNIESGYIFEIVRYKYIFKLVIFFMILLLLIGGLKGLKSIFALIFTGIIVIKVMMPLILMGVDPIKLSIVICMLVTIVNLILISGKNKKTYAAIVGTLGGLFISGVIAIVSNSVMRVKGLTDEEIKFLTYISKNPNFNFSGLLFAGIIMGALGAVMDVSISIAASMKEIKDVNPEIGTRELIKSGITIGQDIIGSMSNTLILAYVGGAMYLMLMISSNSMDFCRTINQDIIASEILRALAGSIGLVFSVPLTAVVYALFEKINIDKFLPSE